MDEILKKISFCLVFFPHYTHMIRFQLFGEVREVEIISFTKVSLILTLADRKLFFLSFVMRLY